MVTRGRYLKRVGRSEHIVTEHGFGNEVRHHIARRVASLKHEEKNINDSKERQGRCDLQCAGHVQKTQNM